MSNYDGQVEFGLNGFVSRDEVGLKVCYSSK